MKNFLKNRSGQSTMEYIMIFVLVVFVVLGGLAAFGSQMNDSMESQTSNLTQTTNDAMCVQLTGYTGSVWTDKNADDEAQEAECSVAP